MINESDHGGSSRGPSRRKPQAGQRKRASAAPSDPYKPVSLGVRRSRAFEAEGGGLLCVHPGQVAASFRLRLNPDPAEGEPNDTASCLVRLADEAGEVWEAESTFSLHVFVENMVNLDRTSWLVYFDDAEEWKGAFDGDRMITGATCLLDDRFYRKFLVGDERVELKFKSQCPRFDVAFYTSPHVTGLTSLLVRVSGLFDVDMNKIRPLVFEMDWRNLLFRNELYFDTEAEEWAGDGWPLPPVFRRAGSTGSPQALVRYEAKPESRAGAG
ncbi:hypothetical protein V5E97_29710 [Singulisphaera sp. Ch08]|uniref:Uncharacterized protein n=1 Tax=Singulisphaera sp. Ch08 TaxID=3120278 RepID=A0AAU7CBI7_9BACT